MKYCKKALTFSYDDGVTQDRRLIEIFNKYGLKATFNLNSELLGLPGALVRDGVRISHDKIRPEEVKDVYAGHEVAVHTLTHPNLTQIEDDAEVIRQVEEDRKNLSALVGYEVLGMAYPCGGVNCDDRTARLIRENTPIRYARTITTTHSFACYPDLYQYKGSVYHHGEFDLMLEMGERFLASDPETPQVFYIWGHAYEFDIFPERWAQFEAFCAKMSGRDDIFYGTNLQVLAQMEPQGWKREH